MDIATGATAYAAVLEALIQRGITGYGVDIEISMFDVMADWLTVPLLNHEAGNSPKRLGMAHPSIAPYGVFKTKNDVSILISVQSDREWKQLADEFLQQPKLALDPRFSTNVARVENRKLTDDYVSKAFQNYTYEIAVAILHKAGIALARVNDMEGLSQHPHLRRITVETPSGPISYPAPGVQVDNDERQYGAVPALEVG